MATLTGHANADAMGQGMRNLWATIGAVTWLAGLVMVAGLITWRLIVAALDWLGCMVAPLALAWC